MVKIPNNASLIADTVTSFLRGCEGKDNVLPDGENASPDLIVWAWKCTTDVCNTGNGLRPPSGNGNGGNGDGLILVPGSSAPSTSFQIGLIFATLFLLTLTVQLRFA